MGFHRQVDVGGGLEPGVHRHLGHCQCRIGITACGVGGYPASSRWREQAVVRVTERRPRRQRRNLGHHLLGGCAGRRQRLGNDDRQRLTAMVDPGAGAQAQDAGLAQRLQVLVREDPNHARNP